MTSETKKAITPASTGLRKLLGLDKQRHHSGGVCCPPAEQGPPGPQGPPSFFIANANQGEIEPSIRLSNTVATAIPVAVSQVTLTVTGVSSRVQITVSVDTQIQAVAGDTRSVQFLFQLNQNGVPYPVVIPGYAGNFALGAGADTNQTVRATFVISNLPPGTYQWSPILTASTTSTDFIITAFNARSFVQLVQP